MSKRTVFTTITPLPTGVSREVVMSTLRNHVEMIDLNPLVHERHKLDNAPSHATSEEHHATWYEITDIITYLPVRGASSKITYTGCFNDLPTGLQTHVHAPLGVEIRSRWTLGGSLPGEPPQPVELGLNTPKTGLYLREDVDLRCNLVFASFVKKTLKKAHETLKAKLVEKTKIESVDVSSTSLADNYQRNQRMNTFDSTSPNVSAGRPSYSPNSITVSPDGMNKDQTSVNPSYGQQQPTGQVPTTSLYPGQQQQRYQPQTSSNTYQYGQQSQTVPPPLPPKDKLDVNNPVAELADTQSSWNPKQQGPLELPS